MKKLLSRSEREEFGIFQPSIRHRDAPWIPSGSDLNPTLNLNVETIAVFGVILLVYTAHG